jgi:hypothetical protein
MSDLSLSYKKVRYDLRPAKQVERLMLVDAMRRLTMCGFSIPNYQYTGMGSVHFYDFSLFHKYAGISSMLSVEASADIEKRVKFNCPYAAVDVKIAKIGSVIGDLRADGDHILWLDYDSTIQKTYLADAGQATTHLGPGSLVLLTVDIEQPKGTRNAVEVREYYQSSFGDLLPTDLKTSSFSPSNLSLKQARAPVYRGDHSISA